jgi:hypothetical protein
MQSRGREAHVRLPIKRRPLRKPLNPPLRTWVLAFVLIVVMVLTIIALGACWNSLNGVQTIGSLSDRLNLGFVC